MNTYTFRGSHCNVVYRLDKTAQICQAVACMPLELTKEQRQKELEHLLTNLQCESALPLVMCEPMHAVSQVFIPGHNSVNSVLAPPTSSCLRCTKSLTWGHVREVTAYSMNGVTKTKKHTLRCKPCNLMYRFAHNGNLTNSFTYHPEGRHLVEVSDTVYVARKLLQLQCSLA